MEARVAEAEAAKSTARASGSLVGRGVASIAAPLCAKHFRQVSVSEGCAMLGAVESVTLCVQSAALDPRCNPLSAGERALCYAWHVQHIVSAGERRRRLQGAWQ